MTDLVLEALREIAPVTRGQVNLGGRMLRWVESGTGTPGGRGHPWLSPVI
jgi:hypothetical protein